MRVNVAKEKELQENLEFLRGRFDALNQDIKLPHSLQPDRMRYQLEYLDLKEEKPRRYRYWRALVGVAACFVVVLGSVKVMNGMEKGSEALIGQEEKASLQNAAVAFPEDMPEPLDAGFGGVPEAQSFSIGDDTLTELKEDAPAGGANLVIEPSAGIPASYEPEPKMGRSLEGSAEGDIGENTGEDYAPKMAAPDYRPLESLEQAREQLPWGNWLPKSAPEGTYYSGGGIDTYTLSVSFFSQDYTKELRVSVQDYTEERSAYLADPDKPETFDLRLYEIPYADSIPEAYFYTTNNPIFRAEEVTQQILEARLLPSDEPGDEKQYHGNVGILYQDGFVVEYGSINVSPEELYQIIIETMTSAQTASPVGG